MSKKITIRLGSRLITRRWLWFARTGYVIYGYELWRPGHEHIVYARDHNNVVLVLQSWKDEFLKRRDFEVHPELPSEIDALPFVSDGNYIMADEWNAVRNVMIKIAEELKGQGFIPLNPHATMYEQMVRYLDEAFPGGYVSTWRWNMRREALRELSRVLIPPKYDIYVFNTGDWNSARPYIMDNTVIILNDGISGSYRGDIYNVLQTYKVKMLVTVDVGPYYGRYHFGLQGIIFSRAEYMYNDGAWGSYIIVGSADQAHFNATSVPADVDYCVDMNDVVSDAVLWSRRPIDYAGGFWYVKRWNSYVCLVPSDGLWKDVSWLDKYLTWLPGGYPNTFDVRRVIHIATDTTTDPGWHQYKTLSDTLKAWAVIKGYKYHDMRK